VSSSLSVSTLVAAVLIALVIDIFSIQASADHPCAVRPHWRNAAAAPVNLLTACNPNRTFRDIHHSGKRPLVREPTRKAALAARKMGAANDPATPSKAEL
jgi:hypothetical protein